MPNARHYLIPALACAALFATAEEPGFTTLFNGRDLTGWDGDPRLWSVRDGVIRGETSPAKPAFGNTFLIWEGGRPRNFELRLKFRVGDANNSGVQFRSEVIGTPDSKNRWVVRGYQAEVIDKPGVAGFLYDEKGRRRLAEVGEFVVIEPGADGKAEKRVVGSVGEVEAMIAEGYHKPNDDPGAWNEYRIVCRGDHVAIELNGHPTVELIDRDPAARARDGVIALQLHGGLPMWVEFKDIRLRKLEGDYGAAERLFNGENLEGWDCKPEQREAWTVRDGALATAGEPSGFLHTVGEYADFVLRAQVRHLEPINSGILLRADGLDGNWPQSIEAQCKKDRMGDIYIFHDYPIRTDPERTKGPWCPRAHASNEHPVGEWNRCEIVLRGGELSIAVNGLVQNRATECLRRSGPICLQSEGGPIEFRNLVLIPIE